MDKANRLRALDNQVRRLGRRLDHLDQVSNRYSWLRVAIVLLALAASGLAYYFLGAWPAALPAALGLLVFGLAVRAHRSVERAMACHRLWLQNKRAQIARATLDWDQIPAGGTFRPRPEHPFESDLDLVGPRSLHLLLDTATTHEGSRRLRDWLADPSAQLDQAQRRQRLVRELAPMHAFRDKLILNGYGHGGYPAGGGLRTTWDAGPLAEWLGGRPRGSHADLALQRRWLLFFAGLAASNVLLLGGYLLGLLPPLWQLTAVLTLALWWVRSRPTAGNGPGYWAWGEALSLRAALGRLGAVFRQLETFGYANRPNLRALCASFLDPRHRPSRYLSQLTRLVAGIGLRQNPFLGLALNLLLPWDAYLAYRLGQIREAMGHRAAGWLEAWFELEALCSLATFAYLNPGYAFPQMRAGGGPAVLQARALGHPLLPDPQKVCNDFTIPHLGWVGVITGSNMAGKSVFLKTVGINLALAYAGGPVNARTFQALLCRLFASMEVSDSVTDGISYFYAEVKRLKALLAALEAEDPLPLLFFVDEIFRGTNNQERLIGSQAYVRALVSKHGAGLIATHDLALASLRLQPAGAPPEGAPAALVNYHFRDQVVDGRMIFDYVLHPGPCPTTNALKIMRLEGLPVPEGLVETTAN